MKQNRSTVMLVVLGIVVAIGLPYYLSSQKAAALDLKTSGIRVEEKAFREKAKLGAKVRTNAAEWGKVRESLAASMPAEADVQGAIRTLQNLTSGDSAPDHVKWLQGSTSAMAAARAPEAASATTVAKAGSKPVPTTATTSAVNVDAPLPTGSYDMTISVSGARNKVLAFVSKIQQKPEQVGRLFSVRSVSLSTDAPGVSATAATLTATPAASDGNTLVKASIQLKVTTFGTPVVPSEVVPVVQPAGPQETTTTAASIAPDSTTTSAATKP